MELSNNVETGVFGPTSASSTYAKPNDQPVHVCGLVSVLSNGKAKLVKYVCPVVGEREQGGRYAFIFSNIYILVDTCLPGPRNRRRSRPYRSSYESNGSTEDENEWCPTAFCSVLTGDFLCLFGI